MEGSASVLLLGVVLVLLPAIEAVYALRSVYGALLIAPCGSLAAWLVRIALRLPASLVHA